MGVKTLAEVERHRSTIGRRERRRWWWWLRGAELAGKHSLNGISLLLFKFNFVFTKVINQALGLVVRRDSAHL